VYREEREERGRDAESEGERGSGREREGRGELGKGDLSVHT
jgi:hypothetical protein